MKPDEQPYVFPSPQPSGGRIAPMPIYGQGRLAHAMKKEADSHASVHDASSNGNNAYFRDLGRRPVMSREGTNALSERSRSGDREARNLLVEGNLRLVLRIAGNYRLPGIDFSDIVAEGNLGLIRAAEKFDASLGHAFSTYATWWIRYRITSFIGRQASLLSWSVADQKRYVKLSGQSRKMLQALGHEPSIAMVAESAGEPVEDAERLLSAANAVVSLDQGYGGDGEGDWHQILSDEEMGQGGDIDIGESGREIDRLFRSLPQRHAMVMRERFGFNRDGESRSLQEIGDMLGITRERVRQIEKSALAMLKKRMSERHLAITDFV